MEISLDQAKLCTPVQVLEMGDDRDFVRRLRNYGLVPGTWLKCCYRCPGGSVTALSCRGTVLALRTKDLQKIRVRL